VHPVLDENGIGHEIEDSFFHGTLLPWSSSNGDSDGLRGIGPTGEDES
jgi:hypothetical protein